MKFARFLADIAVRSPVKNRAGFDPVTRIFGYLHATPETAEKRALINASLTVISLGDEIADADVAALSNYAMALIDCFADYRLSLQYT